MLCARMLRRDGLKQRKPSLFLGTGLVTHTARYDEHLTRPHGHRTTIFFGTAYRQRSPQHKEEFILVRMAVPGKLPLNTNCLEILIVHPGQDARSPKLRQPSAGLLQRKRLRKSEVRMRHETLVAEPGRDRNLMPTLGPAAAQHRGARLGFHAGKKAVGLGAVTAVRLKRALRHGNSSNRPGSHLGQGKWLSFATQTLPAFDFADRGSARQVLSIPEPVQNTNKHCPPLPGQSAA